MGIHELYANENIEEKIRTYSDMVYRLAFSYLRTKADTDDVYQDVFFKFIKNFQSLQTPEHMKAWLIRVTINCCKKCYSSAWKRKTVPLEDTFTFEMPEENYIFSELEKLPAKYRIVIHLFYFEELSIEQIATSLKQKPSTIRTQLTRARRLLKDILREDCYV